MRNKKVMKFFLIFSLFFVSLLTANIFSFITHPFEIASANDQQIAIIDDPKTTSPSPLAVPGISPGMKTTIDAATKVYDLYKKSGMSTTDLVKAATLLSPGLGATASTTIDAAAKMYDLYKSGAFSASGGTGGGTGIGTPAEIGDVIGAIPPSKVNDWNTLATTIVNWLLLIAGALAVFAVVYSGIMYITSAGDSAKAEGAKKNLTWAVIGIVLVVLAEFIIILVKNIVTTNFK